MNSYKVLRKQTYSEGDYSIVPIRFEDRYDIMQWRNEQVYHLRQNKPLTEDAQDDYFEHVVSKLFDEEKPRQLLFSYLKNGVCIGYGGLVHINWIDRNAEISFIINTALEKKAFDENWNIYLSLIEQVAFTDLGLHKIYTFAFDLRPHLYITLESAGFSKEAVLKEHCHSEDTYIDVVIHSKLNQIVLRKLERFDLEQTFQWASDKRVRKYSFSMDAITYEGHREWFENKLKDRDCLYYILENSLGVALGSIRVDKQGREGIVSYLIDPLRQGKGLGRKILKLLEKNEGVKILGITRLVGYVVPANLASIRVFERLDYQKAVEAKRIKYFKEI